MRTVATGLAGPDSVFAVRVYWDQPGTGSNLDLEGALAFPGLTLPGLAAQLRATGGPDTLDGRLLRSLVADGDEDMRPALERYTHLVGYDPQPGGEAGPPQERSRVDAAPHIVQAARFIDTFFGFDQWFLFDTRWAAAHPDLARSLLRYGADWDPYA